MPNCCNKPNQTPETEPKLDCARDPRSFSLAALFKPFEGKKKTLQNLIEQYAQGDDMKGVIGQGSDETISIVYNDKIYYISEVDFEEFLEDHE